MEYSCFYNALSLTGVNHTLAAPLQKMCIDNPDVREAYTCSYVIVNNSAIFENHQTYGDWSLRLESFNFFHPLFEHLVHWRRTIPYLTAKFKIWNISLKFMWSMCSIHWGKWSCLPSIKEIWKRIKWFRFSSRSKNKEGKLKNMDFTF